MNIKGHKNDPVRLDTLSVGDWYERIFDYTNDYECLYPSCIVSFDNLRWAKVKTFQNQGHIDPPDALVHPLTKIGSDFWYRGSEQDDRLAKMEARITALESRERPDPQPAPSPTYLERLPQALRNRVVDLHALARCTHAEREIFARAICEAFPDAIALREGGAA